MTFWKDVYGGEQFYWGGVPPDAPMGMCACGLNDSCVEPGIKCNCDMKEDSDEFQQDDGYITNKDHLPMSAFCAGETGMFHVNQYQKILKR